MAAQRAITACLIVCGANADVRNVLITNEGLRDLTTFAGLTTDEISQLAGRMERREALIRVMIPQRVIKNLQALAFWARQRIRKRQPLDHTL